MPFVTIKSGVKVFYKTVNWDDQKATPFVLLHPGAASTKIWDTFLATFMAEASGNKFRFLLLDALGHGETGRNNVVPKSNTYNDMRDVALAAIQELVPSFWRFVLCGWSMGGRMAEEIASEIPDQIIKLVLVSPLPVTGMKLPPGVPASVVQQLLSDGCKGGMETYQEAMKAWCGGKLFPAWGLYANTMLEDCTTWVSKPVDVLNESTVSGCYPNDIIEKLTKITCPVLLLTGDRDLFLSDVLEDYKRKWGGPVHLHCFHQGSHSFPLEFPQEFAITVHRFLCQ